MILLKKYSDYVLLLPCTLFLIITLGFGIGNSLFQSLGIIPTLGMNEPTFKYYLELLKDESFLSSIYFSFKISFISSIIALVFGVIIAYIIYKNYSKTNLSILRIPIIIPHMVVVLIIITIFSQSGIISRLLFNLGFIDSITNFPLFINDQHGIGIMLTYIWKELPFIALVTYGIMSSINKGIIISAKNLGANESTVFFKIILPLSRKGIITNFLIIFAFAFTSFEVPFLIGPTSTKALPVKAYIEYTSSDLFNRPYAMAVNITLIFISLIILILYHILTKKHKEEI